MRRRGFLVAASVAVAGAAAWILARRTTTDLPGEPAKPVPPPAGYAVRPTEPVFPDRYRVTLESMVERLFPEGPDGPGAATAKAFEYIEGELRRSNMQGIRRLVTNGAVQLDRVARARFRQGFDALSDTDKDVVIMAVQTGEGAPSSFDGAQFVETATILTIEGVYSDPVYGGNANEAGWRSIGWVMQTPRPTKS